MCVCVCVHVTAYLWRAEDHFQESILSFHYVGPRDWTQVVRLGSKYLYPIILLPVHSLNLTPKLLSYYCFSLVPTRPQWSHSSVSKFLVGLPSSASLSPAEFLNPLGFQLLPGRSWPFVDHFSTLIENHFFQDWWKGYDRCHTKNTKYPI